MLVRKGNKVVVMGDGQITQGGSLVVKPNAKKVRRLGDGGEIICGFAGNFFHSIMFGLIHYKINTVLSYYELLDV